MLLDALRARDADAFRALIERYHASLLRLAMSYVASKEAAEDAVQETWMAVMAGVDRFEGRSSLKTWIFRILVNRAKTTGVREHRSVPCAWSGPPQSWVGVPEERLLSAETRAIIDHAIALLPPMQRAVITLRDVRNFTPQETCRVLGISEANQRVLLHRGRSKLRIRLSAGDSVGAGSCQFVV
jgi:RNA polymerase sigma-70 factor (ECF subfamily)